LTAQKEEDKLEKFSSHFGKQSEQQLTVAREMLLEEGIDRDFQRYQVLGKVARNKIAGFEFSIGRLGG
jgi:hypothetical protein